METRKQCITIGSAKRLNAEGDKRAKIGHFAQIMRGNFSLEVLQFIDLRKK